MKNYEVDENNWEEFQKELDGKYEELYKLVPKDKVEELQRIVSRIITLELEITNVGG